MNANNMASCLPVPEQEFMASMLELLKLRGAAREIAVMVNSDAEGFVSHHATRCGEHTCWGLRFALDIGLFGRLSPDERSEAAAVLMNVASEVITGCVEGRDFSRNSIRQVLIVPKVVKNAQWKNDAAAFLNGTGISNQGRVRSDNIAGRAADGLLFRSEPEIHLYRAFKSLGVTFAPLPVFVRGGVSYRRIEPDFVVIKDGRMMVVEVDGDTYHRESPVEADERLAPLRREGVTIERVRAPDCETPAAAKMCADRLSAILDKGRAQARM